MITENEVISCIQLLNKIKEYGHGKIKTRQIKKFKCLLFKIVDTSITLQGKTIVPVLTISAKIHL